MKIDHLLPSAGADLQATWRQRLGASAGMALVALSAALASPAAQADLLLQFSYVGAHSWDPSFNVTGTGQVTVADGAGVSFDLADVQGFSFTLTGHTAGYPMLVQWGLGDLDAFSLLLDTGGAVSGLTLHTGMVKPTHPILMPQGFEVSGPASGGTYYSGGGITSGRVTIDSLTQVVEAVPEPASLALVAAGLLAAAGVRRRRPAA